MFYLLTKDLTKPTRITLCFGVNKHLELENVYDMGEFIVLFLLSIYIFIIFYQLSRIWPIYTIFIIME
jgi:hypothetical protein